MKRIVYNIIILCFCASCEQNNQVCNLDDVAVEECVLETHKIDSVLLSPQSINVWHDKIIVMEGQKKVGMISFFSTKDFSYLFSGVEKGHARNEVSMLNIGYYAKTDSSFFVLSGNEEKEYVLSGNSLIYVASTPITIPDALNQVLHLDEDRYITSGFSNGKGGEHILYVNGEFQEFGEYPGENLEDGGNFFFNGSFSAGMFGKKNIWDFYFGHNLIRSYDHFGNLMEEIHLIDDKRCKISDVNDHDLFYVGLKWNATYLAALYNNGHSWNSFYTCDKNEIRNELQLWSWDGVLKRRVCFDKPFDIYALSDDNKFYAMDVDNPNVIYSYDFEKK